MDYFIRIGGIDMVYGVVVVHDTNDYSKMTMRVWRNGNATLLMNK